MLLYTHGLKGHVVSLLYLHPPLLERVLRTDPHGNLIQNQDVAGLPKGVGVFCGSGWMEGLGFNLCVGPADSLSPSIS